ncbi:uncharacterized protein LOC6612183 isoform X2 [Drosophila sechellia]|uniref:uncharacterized protein LOC6612183 isoform X2 n=1 Tax=Drosophila sechellia TaxID=7238 RepID=UPI0013DE1A5A|nr:uncharacterized protein LOC6612183 isoform X2 [Drosophila sechellia]
MSQPKVPHIVGDDDEYQGALAPESDEITNEPSVESDQDDQGDQDDQDDQDDQGDQGDQDDYSNEDEMDLDGADWSPYVTYEAGAPRPQSALEITEIAVLPKIPMINPTSPKLVVQKPETLKVHIVGPQKSIIISRANYAPSESIGARVSRRSWDKLEPFLREMASSTTPETSGDTGSVSPGQLLAKPVDVTDFFHTIAVGLVEQGICLKPFLALRKHIAQLVDKTLKKSKKMRK